MSTDRAPLPAERPIRCLVDGVVHEIRDVPPTRTVLQWLREDMARTGTKEGCAEGDCGACTVVIADLARDTLRYRAVNACIQFVPTLDGKALFTVESLKRADGALHPVQQAMVDTHGSQCGFCTPGFVMSLFALYKTDPAPDRATIDDALAGNLCRCTGYRPIVDAAVRMYALGRALPPAPHDVAAAPARAGEGHGGPADAALAGQLRALASPTGTAFPHASGTFHAPRTTDELAAVLVERPNARIVAGSTDVGLWVTKQHRALGDVVHTGNVEELHRIATTGTHVEIGAAATVTDAMPALVARWPDLGELFRRYASPPIRNAATLGGNVANGSPIGDSMPALIALGASLVLRKGRATRELPLEDFYLGYQKNALAPGEFVERLRIPLPASGLLFRTYKVSKRFDQDISAVCAAFALVIENEVVTSARIAYGGMAATPKRASGAEAALAGMPWSEVTVATAMAALDGDYTPLTDMRASAEYRRTVARNLLHRLWLESVSPAGVPLRLYALRSVG